MNDAIIKGDYGKHIPIYRFMMERKLGRELKSNEVVHHKDFNHQNNKITNLQVMSRNEHSRLHSKGRKKIITPQEKTDNSIFENKMKGILCYKEISKMEMAQKLNMCVQTFRRKMKCKKSFTDKEIDIMCQLFDIDVKSFLNNKDKRLWDLPKYNSSEQAAHGLLT